MLHLADEAELGVAHQHAGQEAGLAQNLEAVADPHHQPAARRVAADRGHDPRSRRDRAAAQIVAIREPARQHHEIEARGNSRSACQTIAGFSPVAAAGRGHVALAVRPGKQDDRRAFRQPISIA